jgi:plastocyanin
MTVVVLIFVTQTNAFATTYQVTITPGTATSKDCVTADNCFDLTILNINVGDTITWTNTDNYGHTTLSGRPTDNITGLVWDSSLIKPGKNFSFTFMNGGDYHYFCQIHPWMVGEIIVIGPSLSFPIQQSIPQETTAPETIIPTNLNATAISSTQIILSWHPPTQNYGKTIIGYKIDQLIGGNVFDTVIQNTGNTLSTYTITGLRTGTEYTFRVSATYPDDTITSPSNSASATTLGTATPNLSPTNELQVGEANGACELLGGSWTYSTNTCTVNTLTVDYGNSLQIDSGVTVSVANILANFGTINNLGTIFIASKGKLNNEIYQNLPDPAPWNQVQTSQNMNPNYIMENSFPRLANISNNGTISISNGVGCSATLPLSSTTEEALLSTITVVQSTTLVLLLISVVHLLPTLVS